jgi:hypothetical protein
MFHVPPVTLALLSGGLRPSGPRGYHQPMGKHYETEECQDELSPGHYVSKWGNRRTTADNR